MPVSALAPVQAPEALHVVALVEDQLSTALAPLATLLGLALKVTVAVGFALTVMVVDCAAVPPAPAHDKVNDTLAVSAPVDRVPVTGCGPLQPPDAVHEVALVAVHDSVELPPLITELGLAEIFTEGAAAFTDTVTDCAAVPPAPLQLSV